jgi:hypothetical protein
MTRPVAFPDLSRRRLMLKVAIAPFLLCSVVLAAEQGGSPFRFKPVDDKSLGLWEGEKPVFVYNYGTMSREGVPPRYNRSSYIHPLYGLDGEVLTEDFPKDHFHHRGVFWAWPHVSVGGKKYDLWIPTGIRTKFERWLAQRVTPAAAILGVENGWYVGEKRVMDESVWIVAHPAKDDARAIDLEFTWTATDQPVTLQGAEGKSYGGLTIRYNTRVREKGGIPEKAITITVPSGRAPKDLPMTRLEWADLTGPFAPDAKPSGAAIFVDPSHPDFPPTWLTRHYGCLCLGWPGVTPGMLEPGKPVRCAYRIWVHRGLPDVATLKQAYEAYQKRERIDYQE